MSAFVDSQHEVVYCTGEKTEDILKNPDVVCTMHILFYDMPIQVAFPGSSLKDYSNLKNESKKLLKEWCVNKEQLEEFYHKQNIEE